MLSITHRDHAGYEREQICYVQTEVDQFMETMATRNYGDFVIFADGHELGRCNAIITHNRTNDSLMAGCRRTGWFVGDEARKIILNWWAD